VPVWKALQSVQGSRVWPHVLKPRFEHVAHPEPGVNDCLKSQRVVPKR
jgi:hypothetical protein